MEQADSFGTESFEAERSRLVGIATRILSDHSEAEDVVQQAWLRLHRTKTEEETTIENLPAWLTTVAVRLCLDRLRLRTPVPQPEVEVPETTTDPADEMELADTVGIALQVVLERLTPKERVAFVLHDSFGFEFHIIAAVLDTTPAASRKLASRARTKVKSPASQDPLADWEIVDAFLAAAREGDFTRLLALLAPEAIVTGDEAAVLAGTPELIVGGHEVAKFFNGAAAALPVLIGDRPGAAWFHRGDAKVAFEFTIDYGLVKRIGLRGDPTLLADLHRRVAGQRK